MAEQTKIWFHNIRVAFSWPQRSASVHHSHEICDTVQPVHKRWTRLVTDTPWASSTGLAVRPSQSFLLALLDLSVNLHQVLLPLELLGPLKTSYYEELHFLPSKCCNIQHPAAAAQISLISSTDSSNISLLYRCHVRGGAHICSLGYLVTNLVMNLVIP